MIKDKDPERQPPKHTPEEVGVRLEDLITEEEVKAFTGSARVAAQSQVGCALENVIKMVAQHYALKFYKWGYDNGFSNGHDQALQDSAPTISDSLFEDFWTLYDKKIDRNTSMRIWKRLSAKDKKDILDYVPLYVRAQPDKKYRKNPTTFLRHRGWEDEIIPSRVVKQQMLDQLNKQRAKTMAEMIANAEDE